jgi:type IV pilus assembly protein PilA
MLSPVNVQDAKREEGFTLIELLVVVIIIGILAAIAIPVFLNQRERAWRSAAESDVRNAAIEIETYYTGFLVYPGTLADLEDAAGDSPIRWSQSVVDSVGDFGADYEVNTEGTGFCLEAYHLQIDEGDTLVAVYDSTNGGALPRSAVLAGESCSF